MPSLFFFSPLIELVRSQYLSKNEYKQQVISQQNFLCYTPSSSTQIGVREPLVMLRVNFFLPTYFVIYNKNEPSFSTFSALGTSFLCQGRGVNHKEHLHTTLLYKQIYYVQIFFSSYLIQCLVVTKRAFGCHLL